MMVVLGLLGAFIMLVTLLAWLIESLTEWTWRQSLGFAMSAVVITCLWAGMSVWGPS